MKIVLIGIQGSGKSTQGNMLSKQLGIPYLSTGHIFRKIAKEKSPLGKKVKILMSSGLLIPDDLTIEIVDTYLSRPEYAGGYILDGFPRTIEQAQKFHSALDRVVNIEIPDKEALWRLAYRNEQRDDDTIDAIKKRIELFKTHTTPVLEYYDAKGILSTIDGTKAVEEVNQEILKSLGKQRIQDRIEQWSQREKIIIAVVGMPGSGKTEAVRYFEKKGLPIVNFSDMVNKKIDSEGKPHTLEVHHAVRQAFRDEYGFEAFAKLNKDNIARALEGHNAIVIEGVRSWEEYEYLKKEFPKTRIVIVCLFTDKAKRYERIQKRESRSGLYGEARDIDELIHTHMGPTLGFADYMIVNNGTVDTLRTKLDETYRVIIFS